MPEWLVLTTERFLRILRLIYITAAVVLAISALLLWFLNLRVLALVSGAAAWAVAVAFGGASYRAKRQVPSHLSFEELGIQVRYLTGKTTVIQWTQIESVRKVPSGPLILRLKAGPPLTIRTSREEAEGAVARFEARQIRVS